MNRLTLALVAVVLLSGCAGVGQPGASGAETREATTPTIAVSATGTATAEPDLAVVSVGVEATAEDATTASERVATDVSAVRAALADAGVPEDGVTTTAFAVAPVYDDAGPDRSVVGYRASHSLAVEVAPERAGDTVDVAVGAGATAVDGVRFTLSDERRATLRATALDRALSAARTDADGIGAATDRSVTGVRHVSTGTSFEPYAGALFEDAAGGGTTLRPAPVTVSASVDVTYTAA
jgi:uncharacterized protein YggE